MDMLNMTTLSPIDSFDNDAQTGIASFLRMQQIVIIIICASVLVLCCVIGVIGILRIKQNKRKSGTADYNSVKKQHNLSYDLNIIQHEYQPTITDTLTKDAIDALDIDLDHTTDEDIVEEDMVANGRRVDLYDNDDPRGDWDQPDHMAHLPMSHPQRNEYQFIGNNHHVMTPTTTDLRVINEHKESRTNIYKQYMRTGRLQQIKMAKDSDEESDDDMVHNAPFIATASMVASTEIRGEPELPFSPVSPIQDSLSDTTQSSVDTPSMNKMNTVDLESDEDEPVDDDGDDDSLSALIENKMRGNEDSISELK